MLPSSLGCRFWKGRSGTTDRHLGWLLVVGRGNGFSPYTCMKHTMPAGPTATRGVVSLSLVFSLENPFHSGFGLGRETPSQMAALQLTFLLLFFFTFLFALSSGETQICCQITYPRLRKKINSKDILFWFGFVFVCFGFVCFVLVLFFLFSSKVEMQGAI